MTEKTKKTIEKTEEEAVKKVEKETVKKVEEETAKKTEEDAAGKSDRYYEAVGRRKSATARVRIFTKGSGILVNDKDYKEYFPQDELHGGIEAPLKKMKSLEKFRISVKVVGGGLRGQAEAVRHGLSRALIVFNPDFKKRLKRAGYLKRDPRVKERKKYGLKKARKSPRWSKR